MPPLERRARKQKAVLWEKSTGRENYNEPLVLSPVEILVRWEDGQSEALDPQGNTIALDATVYVGQVVPIGSIMRLGALADLPATINNLMQVKTSSTMPSLKNRSRQTTRSLGLMSFTEQLPSIDSGTGSGT